MGVVVVNVAPGICGLALPKDVYIEIRKKD